MKKAVYPGMFDPVTNGHLDVIRRGSKIFGELIVAVGDNPSKRSAFTKTERVDMLRKHTEELPNVAVEAFDGMLIEYVRSKGTNIVLRGIRTISDFENEFQRALLNRELCNEIETVFVMTSQEYSFVSASLLKEAVGLGGSIGNLVPADVEARLRERLRNVSS